MKKKILNFFGIVFLVLAVVYFFILFKKPSHNRNWEDGQEELPRIEIIGDEIEISNFRDFYWKTEGGFEKKYVTERFKMSELNNVDVMISHFSDFEGLAHIFLSFGFSDGRHAVVSMETRREKGEKFSPWRGLLREFEITYVVGSEKDIVGLRTETRKERLYVYPTIASKEKSKELFLKLTEDINNIYEKPKFYNTLFDNCTNVITRRVEDISELKFPFTYKTLFPGYFDEVLHEMKLIKNSENMSFDEVKKCHFVDNGKVDYKSNLFSLQLRKNCFTENIE